MKKKVLICGCIVTMVLSSCGKKSNSESETKSSSTEKIEESIVETTTKNEETTQIIETTTKEIITEKPTQETTELPTIEETQNEKKKDVECYSGTDVPIFNKYYNVQGVIETDVWKDSGIFDGYYPGKNIVTMSEVRELDPNWKDFIDIDKCYKEYDEILKNLGYSKSDSVDEDGYDAHTYVKNNIKVIITISDYLEFTIKDTTKN
ncbi:MAG TPA: hypothetical protein DCW44_02225 [Eubacterium sp.]|nr:hypothetical protein [Eubacterium sp.]